MNKIILCLVMLAMATGSFAQFSKGDAFLGGTLSTQLQSPNSNQSSTSSTNSFSIGPSVGFFLNEKMALGGSLGYSYSQASNNFSGVINQKITSNGFNASLFAKRFFWISEKFAFSIKGGLTYASADSDNAQTSGSPPTTLTTSTTIKTIGVGFVPSFIFFPSPKWGFEGSVGNLGYSYANNVSSDTGTGTFSLQLNNSFSLGLSYYFLKGK